MINATPKEVRKFGLMFSGICVLLVLFMVYKGSEHWPWAAVGSAFFLITGLVGYPILRPIYIGWMKFAFALGWLNTRILLGLFFYLIITPTGLVMRLLGKDLLDEKFEPEVASYWKKRTEPFDPRTMERQF
jgi:hypothetical protein